MAISESEDISDAEQRREPELTRGERREVEERARPRHFDSRGD